MSPRKGKIASCCQSLLCTNKSIFWENKYDQIIPLLKKLQCPLKKNAQTPWLGFTSRCLASCNLMSHSSISHLKLQRHQAICRPLNKSDRSGCYSSLCMSPLYGTLPLSGSLFSSCLSSVSAQRSFPLGKHSNCPSVTHMYLHMEVSFIAVKLFLCI